MPAIIPVTITTTGITARGAGARLVGAGALGQVSRSGLGGVGSRHWASAAAGVTAAGVMATVEGDMAMAADTDRMDIGDARSGGGFGGWGLGTLAYNSGYYPYYNPYYSQPVYQTNVYNYSNPIPVATQGPPAQTAGLAASPNVDDGGPGPTPENYDPVMDAARQSFRNGDYAAALASVDAALAKNQTDAVMHEFRSLVLFARRDYRQSAAVAHSVLAVGPGWDWTTMSSLYPDPQVYTDQLHALEDYVQANPNAADAHFLLGYHYMIGSHAEASAAQFQQAHRIMPSDRLAAELAMMAKGPPQQPQGNPSSGNGGQSSGQSSGRSSAGRTSTPPGGQVDVARQLERFAQRWFTVPFGDER